MPVICLVIGYYIYLHVNRRTKCTTLAFTVALSRFPLELATFSFLEYLLLHLSNLSVDLVRTDFKVVPLEEQQVIFPITGKGTPATATSLDKALHGSDPTACNYRATDFWYT